MVMFRINCLVLFVKWVWMILDGFCWKSNKWESEIWDESDENEIVIGSIDPLMWKDDYLWNNQELKLILW